MKYWRGYLVAAIVAACTWGLRAFSQAHSKLVDLIYPYVTRMMQGHLARWSGGVTFSVWQVLLYCGIVMLLALLVVMLVRHWNPVRLAGWILTVVSLVSFLNTVLYGLNEYAGPLAEDLRMETAGYSCTAEDMEKAAAYYLDQANQLAGQVERNGGSVKAESFDKLAAQAGNGFDHLVYEEGYSVFAGSKLPVKQMTGAGKGTTGQTVALTGEATVNPNQPMTSLPFAMCHEMAHRMCIAVDRDADFAAFLACTANDAPAFRYAGYMMAYRACCDALERSGNTSALARVTAGESDLLRRDMQEHANFFGNSPEMDDALSELLGCWYVETQVLPTIQEEETPFDPTDKSQVDLSGIANAR